MKELFKKNKGIIFSFFIILILTGAVLITQNKHDLQLYINQFHNQFLDIFFAVITFGGDGIFIAIIAVVLLFVRYKFSFYIATSFVLSGIISQSIKRILKAPRPFYFYGTESNVHYVDGINMHSWNSFPSGHTISIFTLMFCAIFLIQNNLLKFLFLSIAIMVGFSRVYLMQHFVVDVYFGSMIGFLSSFFAYLFFYLPVSEKRWGNRSILKS